MAIAIDPATKVQLRQSIGDKQAVSRGQRMSFESVRPWGGAPGCSGVDPKVAPTFLD